MPLVSEYSKSTCIEYFLFLFGGGGGGIEAVFEIQLSGQKQPDEQVEQYDQTPSSSQGNM